MDPLLPPVSEQAKHEPRGWGASLVGAIKKLVKDVNQDMDDFDAVVGELVKGRSAMAFDKAFLRLNHRTCAEWRQFVQERGGPKSLSECQKDIILLNNPAIRGLFESAVVEEDLFWQLWQFHCYLQDKRLQRNPARLEQRSLIANMAQPNGDAGKEWSSWD